MVEIQHSDLMTEHTKDETQSYISAGFTPLENHSHPQSVFNNHGQAWQVNLKTSMQHRLRSQTDAKMHLPHNVEVHLVQQHD